MSYPPPTAPYTYGAYTAYPYSTAGGYGAWQYAYPYVQAPVSTASRAQTPAAAPQAAKPATPATSVTPATKEATTTSNTTTTTRSQRKAATIKGMFTKDCEYITYGGLERSSLTFTY
jgi:cytoskeletal protein RodZ